MDFETVKIIFSVGSFAITGLLAILGYMLKERVGMIDTSITSLQSKENEQDKRMNEIEMNYIDRFNNVERMISNSQMQVQSSIAELGTRIEKKFSELKIEQVRQQGDINQLKHDAT